MFFHFHANRLQIEPHPLQHIDCYALSKFDQAEQEVFRSHVIVVKPLGLLARKRQDLLGTPCWARGVKSFIVAFPMPARCLTLLKVDTAPAVQHLTSKLKEIEYCDE